MKKVAGLVLVAGAGIVISSYRFFGGTQSDPNNGVLLLGAILCIFGAIGYLLSD